MIQVTIRVSYPTNYYKDSRMPYQFTVFVNTSDAGKAVIRAIENLPFSAIPFSITAKSVTVLELSNA